MKLRYKFNLRDIHDLWRRGFDTAQIAKFCRVNEAIIYNYLAHQREKRRKAA